MEDKTGLIEEGRRVIEKLRRVRTVEEHRQVCDEARQVFGSRDAEKKAELLSEKQRTILGGLRYDYYHLQSAKWAELSGETFEQTCIRYEEELKPLKLESQKTRDPQIQHEIHLRRMEILRRQGKENALAMERPECRIDR
jgi:hypothetical protein